MKPVLNYDRKLEIIDGRHPVVEQLVEDCLFVPNNTNLNEKEGFMIITGPNMGGGSPLICVKWHSSVLWRIWAKLFRQKRKYSDF